MSLVNTRRVDLGMGLSFILGEFTASSAQQPLALGPGRVAAVILTPLDSSTSVDSSTCSYTISYTSGSATVNLFGNGTYVIILNTGG